MVLVGYPRPCEGVIARAIEGPSLLMRAQPGFGLGPAAEVELRRRGFAGSRHSDRRTAPRRRADLKVSLRCPDHSHLLFGAPSLMGALNGSPDRRPAGRSPRAPLPAAGS